MLTEELARVIVNKLISVLGKNINLMDKDGYILASGDPSRVATYHEGAAYVIRTGKPLEVWPNDVNSMKGVRPGINLPIVIESTIVGVVGITGNPADVTDYGELVRYTVEVMLEQTALKERIHLQERTQDTFLQDLITGNWGDEKLFILRGALIGMSLDVPRQAMVLEFHDLPEQQLTTKIVAALRTLFQATGEIVGMVGTARMVLLIPINPEKTPLDQRKALVQKAKQTTSVIAELSESTFSVGFGSYTPGLAGLKTSYREALNAITLGHRFKVSKQLFFMEDLALEQMLMEVPLERRKRFYENTIGTMLSDTKQDNYQKHLIETLAVYFEQNLSIKETSEQLYLHRNTLMHRLKKITSATGLNPSEFKDAFRLKLALLFYLSCEKEINPGESKVIVHDAQ